MIANTIILRDLLIISYISTIIIIKTTYLVDNAIE